jgi:hypothetical protein
MIAVVTGLGIAAVVTVGWQLLRDDERKNREVVVASAAQAARGWMPLQPAASTRTSSSRVRNNSSARSTARIADAPTSPTAKQVNAPSSAAFDNVEVVPEVKQAHDALVAAHKRAADVMGKAMKQFYGDITFDAFQKVQNLPEVVQARQAVAEAQREYSGAKSKAMGSGKPDM